MIVFTDFRRIARQEMRRADCNKRIRMRCCFVQSVLLYADRTTEHRKSGSAEKSFVGRWAPFLRVGSLTTTNVMRNRVAAPLEKTYFFRQRNKERTWWRIFMSCSPIRLHSLANNVFTSLRLANLTGTADDRFVIFFFHPANCRTAFFPDILPLGKISSGRDTAKSVILNNKRPPLTQPPSQSYSVPEPAGQGEKSSFSL